MQESASSRGFATRPAFLLLDVLLGISIFALFTSATGFSMLVGQRGVLNGGDRTRGTLLSERALEAARSIRDDDIARLTPGVHGVAFGYDGAWRLKDTYSQTDDGFTTQLTINDDEDWIALSARTWWNMGKSRSGSVTLQTQLTNWRVAQQIGDWSAPELEGAVIDDGTPLYNAIARSGDTVFVAGETSDGGPGLSVFDIADTSAPLRIAEDFDLGGPGYDVETYSGHVLVVTGVDGREIDIYRTDDPAHFNVTDRRSVIDVPGTGRARSLSIFNDTLYVTAILNATEQELYVYDIRNLDAITLLDSLDGQGGFLDIALHEGYAYLASTEDAGELRIADVFDPSDIAIASGSGYNLTDVQDARSIAAYGTGALVGRAAGAAIEELVYFSLEDGAVPTSIGAVQEIGGDVAGIQIEPGGRYIFLATSNPGKELQVLDMHRIANGQPPELGYQDTATGEGRGVLYDYSLDRVFLLTNTALLIYRPAS